jgi:effector protein LidA
MVAVNSTTILRPQTPELNSLMQPKVMDKQQLESAILRVQKWLEPDAIPQKANAITVETNLAPLERISRFGLKSSEDVHSFLESPAGEALIEAVIEEELIEIAAMESAQLEQREIQLHKHYLALLLFGLFYKNNAHAHDLIDRSLEEVSKKLHSESKTTTPEASPTPQVEQPPIKYSNNDDQLKSMLHNKLVQSELLEKALEAIIPQHKEAEAKYAAFNSHIDTAHDEFSKLIAPVLSATSSTPKEPSAEEISEKTKLKIDALHKQVEDNIPSINKLLDEDKIDQARALMTESNAQRLQIAALKEMLAVYEKKSVMFNDKHEPTTSFDDAAFVLASGTKIVEKDDKRYVLKMDQKLDDMTTEEQASAEKQYKKMKPAEMMGIKALVKHNQTLENAKYNSLSTQSEQMQKDILLLANQLTAAQNMRAQTELTLKPTPANSPAMKMTPLSTPTPSPAPKSRSINDEDLAGSSYEHVIRLMKNNPTPEAIKRLKESIAHLDTSSALKKQLNDLKPGVTIPMTAMDNMLTNIRRARPGEIRIADEIANDEKNPTAPSPFKTRPIM